MYIKIRPGFETPQANHTLSWKIILKINKSENITL